MVEPILVKKTPLGEFTEVAYLRKAIKRHTCQEGGHLIRKGDFYIEDRLNRVKHYADGQSFKRWHIHKVCQDCWKAPLGLGVKK